MSGLFETLIAAAKGGPRAGAVVEPRPLARFGDDAIDVIEPELPPIVDTHADPVTLGAPLAARTTAPIDHPAAPDSAASALLPPISSPVTGQRFPADPAPGTDAVERSAADHALGNLPPAAASPDRSGADRSGDPSDAAPNSLSAVSEIAERGALRQISALLSPAISVDQPGPVPAATRDGMPARRDEGARDAFVDGQPLLRIGRIEVRPPPERTASRTATSMTTTAATTRVALPRAAVRQSLDDYRAGRRR